MVYVGDYSSGGRVLCVCMRGCTHAAPETFLGLTSALRLTGLHHNESHVRLPSGTRAHPPCCLSELGGARSQTPFAAHDRARRSKETEPQCIAIRSSFLMRTRSASGRAGRGRRRQRVCMHACSSPYIHASYEVISAGAMSLAVNPGCQLLPLRIKRSLS